jgi:short-subunit dehydrogenase
MTESGGVPAPATKPLAVVTGASSGIGFELAKVFAENGFEVLVNAEDTGLEVAAEQLRAAGADVHPVQADLSSYEGVEQLYAAIVSTGRPVNVAALNAGVGQGGAFIDTDLADEIRIIDLNVTSTVHLVKRLLKDMVMRDDGKMLITSSIASTMPGSFQAVYNASKSFLQSFAQALQNELKDTNVTITSLMPGPTDTNFFHRAGMEDTQVGQAQKDEWRQKDRRRVREDQGPRRRRQGSPRQAQGRRSPPDGAARLGGVAVYQLPERRVQWKSVIKRIRRKRSKKPGVVQCPLVLPRTRM